MLIPFSYLNSSLKHFTVMFLDPIKKQFCKKNIFILLFRTGTATQLNDS